MIQSRTSPQHVQRRDCRSSQRLSTMPPTGLRAQSIERFVADPDRYAPQFNAFCAVMVARGSKREADPEAWVIRDGKLYVFAGKQGLPIFEQQTASVLAKANENWQGLHKAP